jgi:tyrosyl-tRNA synthetase
MLLQAYDFVYLAKTHGCDLQAGGSDQWGNITAGIDLGRRMHGARLQGLTTPLLLKSDGTKMGKTEGGALWLDARRTSPYLFYQYWVNLADDDVGRVLRFFSDRPRAELEAIEAEQARDPAKRTAQRAAAEELTRLVHGDEGLERARRASAALFGGPLDAVPAEELSEIFADVPSSRQSRTTLEAGWPVIEALVATGLCKTKSDARRALEEGGGYVNNVRAGLETKLTPGDLLGGRSIVLRRGKNKYALVTFE